MTPELDRCTSLLDAHYNHTFDYLKGVDTKTLAQTFDPPEHMFMGTRINSLTLGAIVRHLMVAEGHWILRLSEIEDGGSIGFPPKPLQYDGLASLDELKAEFAKLHEANIAAIEGMTDEDLAKTVDFAGRSYSGMGFLWAVVTHHGFHMGQIDMMLRLLEREPVEYMEWGVEERLVA